jgi:hypothetical protein
MIRCVEGRFDRDHVPVTSHALDIPIRLKELNGAFFVMFNVRTQRYEVHCATQPFDTLACTLPFDQLDARAIEYVREHSVERLETIAREIEEHNEKLVKRAEEEAIDKANYKMREAFNYLKNNSKTDSIPKEVIEE